MIRRFQRMCIYVPRRFRSAIALCCVLLCAAVFVVLMHATAMTAGLIAGAQRTTEQMLRESIPRASDKRSGFELQLNKNAGQHSLLSAKEPENLTCPDQSPPVVFFVRIPKAASTSFVQVLKELEPVSSFKLMFHPSGASDWNTATMKQVARSVIRTGGKEARKVIYARHFYYVNFNRYGLKRFAYITILRHPVSRLISSYLYYHFSSKQHIQVQYAASLRWCLYPCLVVVLAIKGTVWSSGCNGNPSL